MVDLATDPAVGGRARSCRGRWEKDPRLVELVLGESRAIVRHPRACDLSSTCSATSSPTPGSISRTSMATNRRRTRAAAAGRSRCGSGASARRAVRAFRVDSPSSSATARPRLAHRHRRRAIGAAGLPALLDLRGRPDLFGRDLRVRDRPRRRDRSRGVAAHGRSERGQPVVLVRAWPGPRGSDAAASLMRPRRGPVPLMRGSDRVVALSGGVGGAKLALGLSRVLAPAN